MNDRTEQAGEANVIAFSLPEFLNIFFRGRWMILAVTLLGVVAGLVYGWITTPLYSASVQVRPGIVSYDAAGNALRGWALKDVVEWFDSGRYWSGIKDREGFEDFSGPPIILAEYIPIGLQWTAGGNIITLTHLSPEPELARLILQESIDAFNRQALEEGNDRDIKLAVADAEQRISAFRSDIEGLVGREELIQVNIQGQQGELKLVDAEMARLEMQRERLSADKVWRERAIKLAREDLVSTRARHTQAKQLLDAAMRNRDEPVPDATGPAEEDNPVTSILLTSARREQAGRVVELLDSIGRLERNIFSTEVKVDTLGARIRIIDIALRDLTLQQEVDLVQRRESVQREISRLQIQQQREVPAEKQRLESQISTEEMKVEQLEALEQISPIQASTKPVRPRRLRATVILTGLAFFGSLFLVLVWEYYRRNSATITAR